MRHKVDIMEYERGWGSRLDESRYFNTKQEADKFIEEFNSVNNEETVPDWYMVAKYAEELQD